MHHLRRLRSLGCGAFGGSRRRRSVLAAVLADDGDALCRRGAADSRREALIVIGRGNFDVLDVLAEVRQSLGLYFLTERQERVVLNQIPQQILHDSRHDFSL